MTHLQRIRSHLAVLPGLCDDCLSKALDIHPRQAVNTQCRRADSGVRRDYSICSVCKSEKLVNELSGTQSESPKRPLKLKPPSDNYCREEQLRERLNNSLCSALNLPKQDYYGPMNLKELLLLKECLARVHDVITLKLTLALVKWLAQRFGLTPEQEAELQTQVNLQHPNEAGFDLDCPVLDIVAEVKGNIPVNRKNRFGSDQLKGLTNDVLQMLGNPPTGKELEKMRSNSKVRRKGLDAAIKLLCLCDTPDVRAAASNWSRNLMARAAWKHLGTESIQEIPATGKLSAQTVYLVYLTPLHSAPQQNPQTSV